MIHASEGSTPSHPVTAMKKFLATTATALAALTLATPAQAQQHITQEQVRVCEALPARNAGFIQVGDRVQQINAPAEVRCYWRNEARRTVVSPY